MKHWSKLAVRFVGALNLAYGLLGAVFLIDTLVRTGPRIRNSSDFPYERVVFDLQTTVNAVFLLGLLLAGYWLLRICRRGAILSNLVLSLEILYFLLSGGAGLFMLMSASPTAKSVALSMANPNGDAGIALQIITLYPVIALVVLNIARWRMNRNGDWK
jgi:hypothetical protein